MLLWVIFKYCVCMKNIIKLTCSCSVKRPILARITTKTRHCSKPALPSFKCAFWADRAPCGEEFLHPPVLMVCIRAVFMLWRTEHRSIVKQIVCIAISIPASASLSPPSTHHPFCLHNDLGIIHLSGLWFFLSVLGAFPHIASAVEKICNNSTAECFGYRASIRLEFFCLWQLPWRKQSLHQLQ